MKTNAEIILFATPEKLAESLAEELVHSIAKHVKSNSVFTIALSGGNTPKRLFSVLADQNKDSIPWKSVHLFWGDERCVPPDHPESNFGMARRILLDKIFIPDVNIHRIKGEEEPDKEAVRYTKEIQYFVRMENGLPVFDLMLLGLGEDGHTASIFPNRMELLTSGKICEVVTHPVNGQQRITLTGGAINHASRIVFLVAGAGKSHIVKAVLAGEEESKGYPATHILPLSGVLKWYIDMDAASGIDYKADI